MAGERNVAIGMTFTADMSPARSTFEQFVKDIQAKGVTIPISAGGNGAVANAAASTIGGITVPSSAGLGAASPNLSFMMNSAANQMAAGVQQAIAKMVATFQQALTGAAGAVPGSSAPVAPGASPSLFTGGGFGRYLGIGFIAHQAYQLAGSAVERSADVTFAGRNQRRLAEAEIRFAKSVPFGFLADPLGIERGLPGQILQDADATDASTRAIREGFHYRQRIQFDTAATTAPGDYARRRSTAESRFQLSAQDVQDRKATELDVLRKEHESREAAINTEYERLGHRLASGNSPENAAKQKADIEAERIGFANQTANVEKKYAKTTEQLEAARKAELDAITRGQRADTLTLRAAPLSSLLSAVGAGDEAARVLLLAKHRAEEARIDPKDTELLRLTREANRAEEGADDVERRRRRLSSDIGYESSTASNFARARNDQFGAQLAQIGGQVAQNILNAPLRDKARAALEGVSQYAAFIGETAHSVATEHILSAGGTAAIQARTAHQPLTAALKQIEANRQAQLSNLPDNPLYNVLFGNSQRADINARATALVEGAKQGTREETADIQRNQATRHQQFERLRDRDPYGAQIAGDVGESIQRAKGLARSGHFNEGKAELGLGVEQLKLTEFQYKDAFRGQALDLRHFDNNNARDTEDPGKVLKEIKDGIDELTAAVKTLGDD
jgi:hypothetical protein